jgi:hypothetical protein
VVLASHLGEETCVSRIGRQVRLQIAPEESSTISRQLLRKFDSNEPLDSSVGYELGTDGEDCDKKDERRLSMSSSFVLYSVVGLDQGRTSSLADRTHRIDLGLSVQGQETKWKYEVC